MAVNNALNIKQTGIITHDGAGTFTGSTITEGGVLLAGASNAVTDTGVLTKGTILVGDGSGAPTAVPVGSNGQVLTAASGKTAGVEWAAPSTAGGGRDQFILREDFLAIGSASTTDPTAWYSSNWVINAVSSVSGHPGIISYASSTRRYFRSIGSMQIGGGQITLDMVFRTPSSFAAGDHCVGWHNASAVDSASFPPTHGIYFEFDSSGNVYGTNRASDTETAEDLSTVASTSTWYNLRIIINAGATSVSYYINDSLAGTNGANIPTSTGLYLGAYSNNDAAVDLFLLEQTLTGDRA